jgi:hypothetical protein
MARFRHSISHPLPCITIPIYSILPPRKLKIIYSHSKLTFITSRRVKWLKFQRTPNFTDTFALPLFNINLRTIRQVDAVQIMLEARTDIPNCFAAVRCSDTEAGPVAPQQPHLQDTRHKELDKLTLWGLSSSQRKCSMECRTVLAIPSRRRR